MNLDTLKSEIESLRKELAEVEIKQRRLSLLQELLKTYQPPPAPLSISLSTRDVVTKPYVNMGVTEAAVAFLKANPNNFYTPREIAEELIDGGVETKSDDLGNALNAMCYRIVGKKLELGTKNGRRAYRILPAIAAAA